MGRDKTRRGGGGSNPVRLNECIPGKDRIVTYEAVAAYSLLTVGCHLQMFSDYTLSNKNKYYLQQTLRVLLFVSAGMFSLGKRVGSVFSSYSTLRVLFVFQVQEWVLCGGQGGGVLKI